MGGREGTSLGVSTSSISAEEVREAMEVAIDRLGRGGERVGEIGEEELVRGNGLRGGELVVAEDGRG